MKISELVKKRMTFSFEVFPPKAEQPLEPLLGAIDKFYGFKPDFMSCTYGAGGTNKGRSTEICGTIAKRGLSTPLAHFTCIGNTRGDVKNIIGEYMALGVENFLLMRGDFPPGQTGTGGDFAHADSLIGYVREIYPELCIAAACYPEKHLMADGFDSDISFLRSKQDNGAELLMTQLCHDVDGYRRFIERVRAAGVTLPIIVGVMPVLEKDSTIRMAVSNGCSIPAPLAEIIGKHGNSPADFKKAGKEWTARIIHKYIASGINGLHLYTLNKYDDVADIIEWSGIRR